MVLFIFGTGISHISVLTLFVSGQMPLIFPSPQRYALPFDVDGGLKRESTILEISILGLFG
jgi:hypothetical protein